MPERISFPTIPEPKEDLKSLNATVLTLKRAVEMLTGQGESQVYAAHVFVQYDQPEAIHEGDLWVCNSFPGTLSVWMGSRWVKLLDVAAVTSAASEGDNLNLSLFTQRQFTPRQR